MSNPADSRAEAAFRAAFAEHAVSFEPAPLAPVSGRPRGRRWMGIVAAASVLAVLGGTAVGVVLTRDDAGSPGGDTDRTASEPPDGWRYESYRDVQIEVPESWGYAAAPNSAWCVGSAARPRKPYVAINRDGGAVAAIDCGGRPAADLHGNDVPVKYWTTHVSFHDPGSYGGVKDGTTTAGGWTRIVRTVGAGQIWVLADPKHLDEARRIVDSATAVGTDHNGCGVSSEIQQNRYVRPVESFDVAAAQDVNTIAVCQYHLGIGKARPGLVASRLLTGAAADGVLAAIKAAPIGGGPNSPETCLHEVTELELGIVLRLDTGGATRDVFVYNASCVNNGFDDGTHVRELTRAACLPLYGGRVRYTSGSEGTFQRCAE